MKRILTNLPVTAWLALTAACAGPGGSPEEGGNVHGRVTNAEGAQYARFGGAGTTEAATGVRAMELDDTGSLTLIAETELDADGSYDLDLPQGSQRVVIQAVAASGEVVAACILDAVGTGQTTATPIDTESSVEALVLVEMVANGVPLASANSVDLRSRIDAHLAAAVRDSADPDAEVSALAEGVAAAQSAELRAHTRAGVQTSQQELFDAELAASLTLSAALDAGTHGDTAYEAFFEATAHASEALGVQAEDRAAAEAVAGMSFRLTLQGRIDAGPTLEAAWVGAGSLEARATQVAIAAILDAGAASGAVEDRAATAAAELRAELSAATSTDVAVRAWADLEAELVGEGSVQTSVLGNYLEVDAVGAVAVSAVVDAAVQARAELDAEAWARVDAALLAGDVADPEVIASGVVDAWAAFDDAVTRAVQSGLAAAPGQVEASGSLVVQATGHFAG